MLEKLKSDRRRLEFAKQIIQEGTQILKEHDRRVCELNPNLVVTYPSWKWEKILDAWTQIQKTAEKSPIRVSRAMLKSMDPKCLIFSYRD